MKKFISWVLVVVMAIVMSSCSDSTIENSTVISATPDTGEITTTTNNGDADNKTTDNETSASSQTTVNISGIGNSTTGRNPSSDSTPTNPVEGDTSVIPDTPYPVDMLTINGTQIKEFVIARNAKAGDVVTCAATELQAYIKSTCGVTLKIVNTPVASGTKRILLDETIITDSDNFKYYSDATGLVIAGSAKRGMIYAVYNFLEECLNWRFFSSDCETCKDTKVIDLKNINVNFVHKYEIRDIYWTEYFDNDISLKRYQNGTGKRRGILGGTEDFHPNGIHTFSQLAGQSETKQPCLNDEAIYQKMFNSAKEWLRSSGSKIIHVSQNDNECYCTCASCAEDIRYYGSPAGSIIKLVNRMDKDLKAAGLTDIKIITFAYRYSFPCPVNITCNDDVAIEICTINNCYNHAFNDSSCSVNADCMKQINAWSKICDEFYIWDYTVNFKYYLSPFANFDVLLENIKYLSTIGAKGIIEQGNFQTPSAEFGDLRCYLMAKVLDNPQMTKKEYYAHMDEFLEAYYGAGWKNVRKFIDFITEMSNKKNSCFNIYSSPEQMFGNHAFEPYNQTLLEWWDEAEKLAKTDTQLAHVRRSRLCCDYLRIGAIHYKNNNSHLRATVETFVNDLKEFNIIRIAENCALPASIDPAINPRAWWNLHEYKE